MKRWSWKDDKIRRFDDWIGKYGLLLVLAGAALVIILTWIGG